MTRLQRSLENKPERVGALLVSIPILGYWVYWTLNPSYWFNADPAAVYFIDSLAVFAGKSYVYVDHPGTPVQLIGTFLLALAYPFFGGSEAFIQFFLSRPNAFFLMTNLFLLAANLFCAIAFYGTVVRDLKQNPILGAAAISLLFFALHPYSYPSLTLWSHNSLNFPFATLLLVWLYRELQTPARISNRTLVLLGIAAGILSIAQMYFFAWLAAVIFTVAVFSWRRSGSLKASMISALYVIAGGLLGILLMLLPIYKELPRFLNWFIGIVTHLGLYGSGQEGIYSLALLSTSIAYWWASIRPMMILLLCALALLGVVAYWSRKTGRKLPDGDFSLIVGLLFHIGLVLLMLTKAALKLRYSLALAAILPVFLFLLVKVVELTPWKFNRFLNLFYALILVAVAASLIPQVKEVNLREYVEQDAQLAKVQAINRLAKELHVTEEEVVVVYAYGVPTKCAGMLQAANWTGHLQEEMSRVCPNQYAVWDTEIELNPAAPHTDLETIDWDVVIWPGNGTNLPDYLYSRGAIIIPDSWHVRRNKWFYIHPVRE